MTLPNPPHDLFAFLRAVGGPIEPADGFMTVPTEREVTESDITMTGDTATELSDTADPLPVTAYLDGVQTAAVVAWRNHRPIYIRYVGAGAVSPAGVPLACREQLQLVASAHDMGWATDVAGTIQVVQVAGNTGDEILTDAVGTTSSERDSLERALAEELGRAAGQFVIADGGLIGRPSSLQIAGVVKDTRRRYLTVEQDRELWDLPAGWMSPTFMIHGATDNLPVRYSCYLRLHDNTHRAWNFGLVRLETFQHELLEPLAVRVYRDRQGPASNDSRWDRHLQPIRMVEDFLRARRPHIF